MDITQEMINQAGKEESDILAQSPAVLQAQNQHLHSRVVVLRALVNEQKKELEELKNAKAPTKKAPSDRRPKKTPVKRVESSSE